ncbi:alpha/beta-hydrolase [Mycena amicta]|nr:alpha/beta-hydrolase [Mycena amicta]
MLGLLPFLLLLPTALALPLFGLGSLDDSSSNDTTVDPPTPLSLSVANNTLLRPGFFARVAYCPSDTITSWTCGAPCDALTGVTFLQSGGDEGAIPLYYIAHSVDDDAIVVAHEGTDPKKLLSILNDAQFGLVPLNVSRFPGTEGQNITVHDGFQQTFERTADGLLSGVLAGLAATNASQVIVAGHSLGAALAGMTGAFIKTSLAASETPDVDVSVTGFGLPRGGNPAFASFLQDTFPGPKLAFVTNQHDPVPQLPPLFLGFVHPEGEVHVVDDTQQNLVSCPGQDNEACATGNSLFDISVQNHLGPYFSDLTFGASQCSS